MLGTIECSNESASVNMWFAFDVAESKFLSTFAKLVARSCTCGRISSLYAVHVEDTLKYNMNIKKNRSSHKQTADPRIIIDAEENERRFPFVVLILGMDLGSYSEADSGNVAADHWN